MTDKIKLNYYLPTRGYVGGILHDESASICKALINSKELDRIKRIPQLGIVSEALPGAKHSRYEYALLLIYLFDYCKQNTDLRLNTAIDISSDIKVSSQLEVLNSWALLLQTGHLYWTFTTERILLEQINAHKNRDNIIAEFLDCISSQKIKNVAQNIFDNGNYYRFHQVLAYYRLAKKRSIKDQSTQKLAEKLLDAYIHTDSNRLQDIKKIFSQIRRVAYLALDSEYSPSVVGIRLNHILGDNTSFENLINSPSYMFTRNDELNSVETHLIKNVYLGRTSLLETAKTENDIIKRIQRPLPENLISIVEELARPQLVHAAKRLNDVTDVIRFVMDTSYIQLIDSNLLNVSKQKDQAIHWASRHGVWLRLGYEIDANENYLVYQGHASKHDIRGITSNISYAFRFVNNLAEKIISRDLFEEWFQILYLQPIIESILLSALHYIFDADLKWEWNEAFKNFRLLWLKNYTETTLFNQIIEDEDLTNSKLHEMNSTIESVSGLSKNPLILSLANLVAYKNGQAFVELDGVALTRNSKGNEIILTVVEAKSQGRSAENDCKKL